MDGCTLAETGVSFYGIVGVSIGVILLAGGMLVGRLRPTFRGIVSVLVVGALAFGVAPHRAFADAVCNSDPSSPTAPGGPVVSSSSLLRYAEIYFSSAPTNGERQGVMLLDPNVLMWELLSSSDGTKLTGIDDHGYVYTSSDSGTTWTMHTLIAGINDKTSIIDIAGSADGIKLVVTVAGGYVYTSSDSGATWIERSASGMRNWSYVTSSSDGSRLAAIADDTVYTSSDSGATWNSYLIPAGMSSWTDLTSSGDGMTLAIAPWYGYIYTSSDGGVTWTERTDAGERSWYSVASSSDGSKFIASTSDDVYMSVDSGATWTQQPLLSGLGAWYRVAVSSDGSTLIAASNYIYTSTNSGATWTQQVASGDRSRSGLGVSANGSRIVSIADGSAYVSADAGVTWAEHHPITAPDPYTVDIDPSTPGLQRTVDMTATEGWSATFNPATAYFEVTVTDDSIFDANTMRGYHSVYLEGKEQLPFAPIIFYQGADVG